LKTKTGEYIMIKFLTVLLAISILMMCSGQQKDQEKPLLSTIQKNIFDKQCATPGCHSGYKPQDQLDLGEGQSYKNLVNVPCVQIQDLLLVDPGHPDKSYLMNKIEGTQVVGERMPMGKPPLPDTDIKMIRRWIKDGAKNN
jgi:hypothetical protein